MGNTFSNTKLSVDLTKHDLKKRQEILSSVLTLTHKNNNFLFIISGLDVGLEQIYEHCLSTNKKIVTPAKKGLFKPLKKLYLMTGFEFDKDLVIKHLDDFNEGQIIIIETSESGILLDGAIDDMDDYVKRVEVSSDAGFFTVISKDNDYLNRLASNMEL